MNNDDVSDEDKKLFRHMMKGVKPLKSGVKKESSEPPPLARSLRKSYRKNHFLPEKETEIPDLSDYYAQPVQAESILSYHPKGLSPQQFKQLKTGKIAWEARLDLHGLSPDGARESIAHFIQLHYKASHRCLLIIHGKGGKRGEVPILKNLVNHWLRQFSTVLAFHSAIPKDGGAGALYVLLKRRVTLPTKIVSDKK